MWQRRAFIKAAGAGFVAGLLPRQTFALSGSELIFASAVQNADGGYGAALVNEAGKVISAVPLPSRGHDVTFSPIARKAVVFARQPGAFAVVFDVDRAIAPQTVTSPEGRHFFGHGAFSRDGRLLYATENDFEAARSVIGLYEVAGGYRRVGEFDGHGIGAHEMLLSPDGELLVIANGGIETHPDYGDTELNLATMESSLVFLDARTGDLIGRLRLSTDLYQLSIRHLAFDALGRVWFGCQFKGGRSDAPQLVGYATREGDIRLVELPHRTLASLRNYVGAVASSRDGSLIAVSSPEGGTLLAIDATAARPAAVATLAQVCGIATDGSGFLASNTSGVLVGFSGASAPESRSSVRFDNHLRALTL
jgi:hypothetical protein